MEIIEQFVQSKRARSTNLSTKEEIDVSPDGSSPTIELMAVQREGDALQRGRASAGGGPICFPRLADDR
jgi:hypothetical protein